MTGALPVGQPSPPDGALPSDLIVDPSVTLSAYIHVPFCRVRCGYCDFNTYTSSELDGVSRDTYADTLIREVALAKRVLGTTARPLHTVFLGGGTPTLLPPGDLARMLAAVRDAFGIQPGAEITVEANPDTVTLAVAQELADAGVTRLSIGMQSSVPHVLAALDRTHNPESVTTAVEAARAAHLAISLDLIYGAPGESLDDWRRSLHSALSYAPDHISAYALIIEEGTKLARQIRRGEVAAPDDDLQADMYELAESTLADAGFHWYEVSNWAVSDADRSDHNRAYWTGGDWWGFGPGAHSHVAGLRWWNVKHPSAYAERVTKGESPAAARERPNALQREAERVLLQSRLREGISIASLPADNRVRVAGLIADGLIDPRAALGGDVQLTLRGRLLADIVVRELTS